MFACTVADQTVYGQAILGVDRGKRTFRVGGYGYIVQILVISFGFKTEVFAQHYIVGNYVMPGFGQVQVFVSLAVITIFQGLLRIISGHAFMTAVYPKSETN